MADARETLRPPSTGGDFRSDINGLRAISIALVVAFHVAPRWAPGGFVGVDVFFVISGYLMTRIIEARLRGGRFRLRDFYVARLRRIWPALVALCAVLALAGAVALDPWSYDRLAAGIPAAMFFVSNIVFAARSGYFAPDARTDWLRHTWSLSLEWQFYLLYPLLLILVFAVPALRRRLWCVLAALAALSFVASAVAWAHGSTSSFYLLPTRAWELLAGALIAPAEARLRLGDRARGVAHLAGLLLIGVGAVLARGDGWPSPIALLPVGGAALVVAAAARRTLWAETAPALWIGRASYSIYIWHWPILVALRDADVRLDVLATVGAVAAMLAVGLASYALIERRATAWLFAKARWRWALGAGLAVATGGLALAANATHGFEAIRTARLAPPVRAALLSDRQAPGDWAYPAACGALTRAGPLDICQEGDPAARQVAVIGDSHAEQLAPRWAHAFDGKPGEGLTFVTRTACLPIPGVGHPHDGGRCAPWAGAAFDWARRSGFRRVVIVSSWLLYFDTCPADGPDCNAIAGRLAPAAADAVFKRLAAAVARLQAAGIEVVLIGPTPRADAAAPQAIYRQTFRSARLGYPPIARAAFEGRAGLVRRELAALSRRTGAPLVDPLDWLCPRGACPVADANGAALFKDTGHYRATAVRGALFAFLDPWLAPSLNPRGR